MNTNKVLLMILDGWGKAPPSAANAISVANTPFMDSLSNRYPSATLLTDGLNVGLPEGQMGNSEVGHLNIGAGRVVYQDLVRINLSIETREFFKNPVLVDAMNESKKSGSKLHLMGLVSDGGVHSSQVHLHALLSFAAEMGHPEVFVHAFTDGRDTDPQSGADFIARLESHISQTTGTLATLVGRYYAMDRDQRWERVKVSFDLLTKGIGQPMTIGSEALRASYAVGVTDEFVKPFVKLDESGKAIGLIEPGDTVICFNFRTDRCRQITRTLTQEEFPEFGMAPLSLNYVTMTNYDANFKGVKVLFEKDNLKSTLGEVVSTAGLTQLRIAETEKYPHVTFFFSGGRETVFPGEERIMVPSPKVATYDLQPEMSAEEVKNKVIESMENKTPDFVCLNFANPDMVGHTGVFGAIVKACEKVDACAQEVADTAIARGYDVLIIADHGNADKAINEDGSPNTAHTTNPVPFHLLTKKSGILKSGVLADVAPTILSLLGVSQPPAMSGQCLFVRDK
jgi:2,3-bisphosphoglycerate-independent phosphoglycerate mutase